MPLSPSSSQMYRHAVDRLTEAGIGNAQQEALWIIEEASDITRLQIYADEKDVIDSETYHRVGSLIERRALHEPLQYVLGSQEFCGVDIAVKPGVLIPRPESELLVEEATLLLRSHAEPVILDVGTGSGCLAISLVRALKHAVVIASDLSVSALQVAKSNAGKHARNAQILWLAGDLLAPLLSSSVVGKVTAIIANLPYISHEEWDRLSPDVKDFEPWLALDGGPDGLDVYRRLLREAPCVLAPDGIILMEIGIGQADCLRKEVEASPFFDVMSIQSDFQGIPRMVCVRHNGQS